MKKALMLIGVVALTASFASAQTPILTVTPTGQDGAGNDVYELYLDTDGLTIEGIDLSLNNIVTVPSLFSGALPITPIWNDSKATMENATFNPTGLADTYINFASGVVTVPPGTSGEPGDGTLTAVAFVPQTTGSNVLLGQVVVPGGQSTTLSGVVGDSAGTLYDISTTIPVPEPASMSLLGLGGLALLRRRKK